MTSEYHKVARLANNAMTGEICRILIDDFQYHNTESLGNKAKVDLDQEGRQMPRQLSIAKDNHKYTVGIKGGISFTSDTHLEATHNLFRYVTGEMIISNHKKGES